MLSIISVLCIGMGSGVPEDDAEAVKWWKKAAEQGHALAQYDLGAMYAKGEGVPQDHKEAVKWYRKSAEQGYADAQSKYALLKGGIKAKHLLRRKALHCFPLVLVCK